LKHKGKGFRVWWFDFLNSWLPLLWGPVIFSFLIQFFEALVCQMRQEEWYKFCSVTRNKGTLPLDLACPECLNVQLPAGLPYTTFLTKLGGKKNLVSNYLGYFNNNKNLIKKRSNLKSFSEVGS